MIRITNLGPALVVAGTLVATLVAGPRVVRSLVRADAEVAVIQAAARLESNGVLEAISAAQRDLATVVEPSVVHVSSEGSFGGRQGRFSMASSGSGWIWDEEGHIVTNAHVVEAADRIEVQLFDGEVRSGEVIGLDLRSDIAVVKVPGGDLIPARLGDSRTVSQGDLVFAFGSPFDFRFSMSSGIVSGLGRSAGLDDIDFENFIQVDAAINPGNSGGPLTDASGRVIGMNTAIATGRGNGSVGQGQFAGIGLAIPLSQIGTVVEQVIETGEVRKGFLGVTLLDTSRMDLYSRGDLVPEFRPFRNLINDNYEGDGVAIQQVSPGGPASRSELRTGDVITGIDGRRVRGIEQLQAMISSARPDAVVIVEVWRIDPRTNLVEELGIEVTLGEMDQSINRLGTSQRLRRARLGTLVTSTPQRAEDLGIDFARGVLVGPSEAGATGDTLFPVGTLIQKIDGITIGTLDELFERIDRRMGRMVRSRQPARVLFEGVLPDGRPFEVEVPL
ncbi:MAG: hypothetical protein CMJ34_05035 [Phycisphaerae bacterium]|nr:hypothetical protein [Phycisphaerae bacterium]